MGNIGSSAGIAVAIAAVVGLSALGEPTKPVYTNGFDVTFLDSDGVTVIGRQRVAPGGAAVAPVAPARQDFEFVRWDRSYSHVTSDMQVKAVWRSLAAPPSGYHDVTTYKSSLWITGFDPLVANDPTKASANVTNLKKMLSNGIVLYFPRGTYYIDATVEIDKKNVTFWGDDATIVRTGVPNTDSTSFPLGEFKATANLWITANGFKMHGFTIKYDVPTSFTGTVTARSGNTVTVRLTDGQSEFFSENTRISRVNSFDDELRPAGVDQVMQPGTNKTENYLDVWGISSDANGVKSFMCWINANPSSVRVGQKFAMACGSGFGQNIVLYGSESNPVEDTVFEDVTVANSFGMIMLVRHSKNLTLTRFRVDNGSDDNIYTGSVDGIHATSLGGKLTMTECAFKGLADDALNVHCIHATVKSVGDLGKMVTLVDESDIAFKYGETVHFYSPTLEYLGETIVTSYTSLTKVLMVSSAPDSLVAGCYVVNEDHLPEIEITGTSVGITRARGFLLQTDKPVVIRNSEFRNTRLAGLLCASSASDWGEMGPVNGVTVSNCTFTACGYGSASTFENGNAAITVRANHDSEVAGSYADVVNRNVVVCDSTFRDCPASGVNAANTSGLVVTNNVFYRCGGNVAAQDGGMVRLKKSSDILVADNICYSCGFTDHVLTMYGTASDLTTSGNRFFVQATYVDADATTRAKEWVERGFVPVSPAWTNLLSTKTAEFCGWALSPDGDISAFEQPMTVDTDFYAVYRKISLGCTIIAR